MLILMYLLRLILLPESALPTGAMTTAAPRSVLLSKRGAVARWSGWLHRPAPRWTHRWICRPGSWQLPPLRCSSSHGRWWPGRAVDGACTCWTSSATGPRTG